MLMRFKDTLNRHSRGMIPPGSDFPRIFSINHSRR
jgi:hypothetical protein